VSDPTTILLLCGSLREGSTNAAALRTAGAVAPTGVRTVGYDGMGSLPHFNPDDDREGQPVDPAVETLRIAIGSSDALLICTPEYAGALPGAFKNLLEWTVGDAGTYRKPVAWVNVSGPAAPSGGADAHDSLRKVLGYVHATVVEQACLRVPLTRDEVDPDGAISDPEIREQLARTLQVLAEAARRGAADGSAPAGWGGSG
jgi:chromate reductase, NAD(P)H dehydrogenase (quinone)